MSTVTVSPARTEAEAVTTGWRVFRAAQEADWPPEHAREIGRAVTRLWYELDMHGRLNDEAGRLFAPGALAAHAVRASERAAEVIGVIRRYCGEEAAEKAAARGRTA